MPEHRPFPYKYLPKMGVQLGVTFGDPIPPDKITAALNALRRPKCTSLFPDVIDNPIRHSWPLNRSELLHVRGWLEGAHVQAGGSPLVEREGAGPRAQVRSEVTAIIQRAVEDLGRTVSGHTLGLPPPHRRVH